jgi:hypothetical protein
MGYNNDRGIDLIKSKSDSEYVYIIDERTIWFIDHSLGVAFPTPVNFAGKENCLYDSGLPYKEFADYLDFQNYLEEITGGQEVSLESSVNPDTFQETNRIIKWVTKYAL